MYLHLGDILKAAGKHKQAMTVYQQGLSNNPDDPELKKRVEER